jgi:hypothetical protein
MVDKSTLAALAGGAAMTAAEIKAAANGRRITLAPLLPWV